MSLLHFYILGGLFEDWHFHIMLANQAAASFMSADMTIDLGSNQFQDRHGDHRNNWLQALLQS